MRTNYYFIAMLLFAGLFSSCMKQSPEEMQEEKAPYLYMLNMQTMEAMPVSVAMFSDLKRAEPSVSNRNPNSSTNGIYTTVNGGTCEFSAMHNPSGIHGSSEIGGSLGLISLEFNSDCLTFDENRAYFGGEITSMEVEEGVSFFFEPGWSWFAAVEDNGQGNNAPADRYGQVVYLTEPGTTPESVFGDLYGTFDSWCSFLNWAFDTQGSPFLFIDGVDPTNIKVNP